MEWMPCQQVNHSAVDDASFSILRGDFERYFGWSTAGNVGERGGGYYFLLYPYDAIVVTLIFLPFWCVLVRFCACLWINAGDNVRRGFRATGNEADLRQMEKQGQQQIPAYFNCALFGIHLTHVKGEIFLTLGEVIPERLPAVGTRGNLR